MLSKTAGNNDNTEPALTMRKSPNHPFREEWTMLLPTGASKSWMRLEQQGARRSSFCRPISTTLDALHFRTVLTRYATFA